MLKDYSLLTFKQFIILLKDYRQQALDKNNHDTSKHLFHIKKYLRLFNEINPIKKLISYHNAIKYLVNPYLYDDNYDKKNLVRLFNLTKQDANKTALKIIKSDKKFGSINSNMKHNDQILKNNHQKVYTPIITKGNLKKSLLLDNYNAKLLFKKYYHNSFKKANEDSSDIGSSFYSTVGSDIDNLSQSIKIDRNNIRSFNQIINFIKKIIKINPFIRDNSELGLSGNHPLDTYQLCLENTKKDLKSTKSSLKAYQNIGNNNILLCNSHVATPNDIERDVHRYSQIHLPLSEYAKIDLDSIKND